MCVPSIEYYLDRKNNRVIYITSHASIEPARKYWTGKGFDFEKWELLDGDPKYRKMWRSEQPENRDYTGHRHDKITLSTQYGTSTTFDCVYLGDIYKKEKTESCETGETSRDERAEKRWKELANAVRITNNEK